MAVTLAHCGLDTAKVWKGCSFFVEEILDARHVCHLADTLHKPFGDVPFFADDDQHFALAAKGAFVLPKAQAEAAANTAPSCQELEERCAFIGDFEIQSAGRVKQAEAALELFGLGADLAGEDIVLTEQQIIVIVIKHDGQAIVCEHKEGERAGLDFVFGDKVAHQRLEECLVWNPGCFEKTHDVAALFCEIKDPFESTEAQTPPLGADLDLEIIGDFAGEAEFALKIEGGVKAALLCALVEEVVIDEPLFFHAGLDLVTFKIVKAFDIVDIGTIKELIGVFGGFDGHAVP